MHRLLILLLALCAWAPYCAHAVEDARLLEADAQWNTLRLQADVAGLDRLLVDDWLLTHSDGRVQTKREYLDELATRSRRNQAIDNEDVAWRSYGETAVVTGVSVQAAVSAGTPWSGRFRFTRVWVREGDAWRMVASHSSRIAAPQ